MANSNIKILNSLKTPGCLFPNKKGVAIVIYICYNNQRD
jgi:hypothetical protein